MSASAYGYPKIFGSEEKFHDFYRQQFAEQLQGMTYLDHAGATLFARSQLTQCIQTLLSGPLANPHSQSQASARTAEMIDEARGLVLRHFMTNSREYDVVFTSGATHALRLIGELFPWSPQSHFSYLVDNHTSVVGIREQALAAGVRSVSALHPHSLAVMARIGAATPAATPAPVPPSSSIPPHEETPSPLSAHTLPSRASPSLVSSTSTPSQIPASDSNRQTISSSCEKDSIDNHACHLFAFPAESNFSGVQYDLNLIQRVQQGCLNLNVCLDDEQSGRWFVLLDAAKFVGTNPLDLNRYPADFVTVSFYKMFGYPTGLGALLIRKTHLSSSSSLPLCFSLRTPIYHGGGTVSAIDALSRFHVFRTGIVEQLEAGTSNFQAIAALSPSFRWLMSGFGTSHEESSYLAMSSIRAHVRDLTRYAVEQMQRLRHHHHGTAPSDDDNYHHSDTNQGHHENRNKFQSQPLVEFYGSHDTLFQDDEFNTDVATVSSSSPSELKNPLIVGQGGVIACSLRRANGDYIGFAEVEQMAAHCNIQVRTSSSSSPSSSTPSDSTSSASSSASIQLRTGCFCNPGACQWFLRLGSDAIERNYRAGHVCWDKKDIADGLPTGAIRISFGYMSTKHDVDVWIQFLKTFFLSSSASSSTNFSTPSSDESAELFATQSSPHQRTLRLRHIFLYPIKSCGAIRVIDSWPLGPRGLLWDREWSIVDTQGRALSQKKYPHLCHLQPAIDFQARTLTLTWSPPSADSYRIGSSSASSRTRTIQPLVLPLDSIPDEESSISVCGDQCSVRFYGQSTSNWLSDVIGVTCTLARLPEYQQPLQESFQHAKSSTHIESSPSAGRFTKAVSANESQPSSTSLTPLSFANEGQYLLITQPSFEAINELHVKLLSELSNQSDRLHQENDQSTSSEQIIDELSIDRFRPNFVVDCDDDASLKAFEEDSWMSISVKSIDLNDTFQTGKFSVDSIRFRVDGPCTRCAQVNVDQRTASRDSLLFKTLAMHRRINGRITFGVLMSLDELSSQVSSIRVDSIVNAQISSLGLEHD